MSSSTTLSFGQGVSLDAATWFSSALSLVGSSCIIYLIRCGPRPFNPFKRIMLGMSVCDIINSFWLLWSGILVPRDTSPRPLAIGNTATCSTLGFFLQFGFSALIYGCSLSFYYLYTIRFGYTDERIRKNVEPYLHGISIGFPLLTATVPAVLGAYNELDIGIGCWIANWPDGCETAHNCYSQEIAWAVAGIPFLIGLVILAVNNLLIYRKVRSVMLMGGRRSSNPNSQALRTQQVATQAYLYVAAFLMPCTTSFVIRALAGLGIVKAKDEAQIFPLLLLNQLTFPLQGFCNFIVYIRPRYLRMRSNFPTDSIWTVLKAAMWAEMQSTPYSRSSVRFSSKGTRRLSDDGIRIGSDDGIRNSSDDGMVNVSDDGTRRFTAIQRLSDDGLHRTSSDGTNTASRDGFERVSDDPQDDLPSTSEPNNGTIS